MTDPQLNLCPMCGSKAKIDSTAAAECYGWAWQTVTVECTDEFDKECGMEVSIQADMSYVDNGWNSAIKLWNSLRKM